MPTRVSKHPSIRELHIPLSVLTAIPIACSNMAEPSHSALMRHKLPIGIQSFRRLREGGCHYVDKTPHIERLIGTGDRYFLSRPRRFGKSLLVDTIARLFLGSEVLFRGLAIHDRWDWSVHRPVLRLEFAAGSFASREELEYEVVAQLWGVAQEAGLPIADEFGTRELARAASLLRWLLNSLRKQAGRRVAVLVDEYDMPILDNLGSPEIARSNRDFLSHLYRTFKACDDQIHFLLLTGVSKFSKVNLFSGLNNLKDITLDPRFATICGYTQNELDTVFAAELEGLNPERVKEWYNGYRWLGEPVYNPFDVLLLLDSREFRPHWFETGTPTFLVDMVARRGIPSFELDGTEADTALLSAFDVEHIASEALLWQTGYLTIQGVEEDDGEKIFRLGYPNLEVRRSLHRYLFAHLVDRPSAIGPATWRAVRRAFGSDDLPGVEAEVRALFASIPYQWHARNDIAHFEGYYASVLYSFLAGSGLDVRVEDSSAAGRLDAAVLLPDTAWLFELKVDERTSPGAALHQLKARGYAKKYRQPGRTVRLVGIHFSEKSRTVSSFETAEA